MTNSIHLHRIIDVHDPYLPLFEELYVSAFPEQERRDTSMLRLKIDHEPRFHAHAIVSEDRFIGLLTWWDFESFVYGEHFATLPQIRGKGIGAKAISVLQGMQHGGRPIIIEVEPPVDELTQRRVGFYTRMGLRISDLSYRQPPYRKGDKPLPLKLMLYGKATDNELKEMTKIIHREVYDSPHLMP